MPDKTILSAEAIPFLLNEMDLDFEGLRAVVRYADSERALTSAHDTPGLGQAIVYHKAGRGLRDRFCGRYWEIDNSDNHTAIKHRTKPLRIVPCNFDQNTGNALIQPRNRTDKGAVMASRTMCNATGSLFEPEALPIRLREGRQTWILGIYSFEELPLRAEFSLPVAFSGNFITDLAKRVILMNGDEEPRMDRKSSDPIDPIDVVDIKIEPRA